MMLGLVQDMLMSWKGAFGGKRLGNVVSGSLFVMDGMEG